MLRTRICDLFGIELPIIGAGMGGVAMAELAAAISNAGGLGTLGLGGLPPEVMRAQIKATRELTAKPFAVNLLVPLMPPGAVEAVLEAGARIVTFFWGDCDDRVAKCKRAGAKVIWHCGSPEEAAAARGAGVDAVIAQGFEAGGHVRGTTTTMALIPQVRDAIGDLPLIAAGGIADGRGFAAALALGADGAAFGTRFLLAHECLAHADYKRAISSARSEDTLHTTLYDIEWPNAAHRVLRTPLVKRWEDAGRPASGKRPGEGEQVGKLKMGEIEAPLVRYSAQPPVSYFEGDTGGLAWYAGQSCALVREALPAGEIVRRIAAEAREVIAKHLAPLA